MFECDIYPYPPTRFKQGAITEDTFVETYNQFKHDKAELEQQIKARLRKE
jgi:hypothetical protein